MTARSWFCNWFARNTSKTSRSWRRPSRRTGSKLLALEVLEDRTLPSGTPSATLQLLPAAGQGTPAVMLALDSFRFDFHNSVTFPTGGIGATVGPVSFDALDVTAAYNANSPEVFAQLTSGLAYDGAVLTQKDASGSPVAAWVLRTVFVSDDALSGNGLPPETVRGAATAPPTTEELRFAFEEITEATSAGSQSRNQLAGSNSGPALPAGLTLSELPAPAPTGLTLQLAGGDAPAATLSLTTFQFGSHIQATVTSGSGAATVGSPSFDALEVTAALSKASPDLFHALASGEHYDTVTLTETDSAGQPVGVWVLQTVFITDDAVTGTSGGLPAEQLRFSFEDITEGTSAGTASWSLPSNSDTGSPGLPTGLTLSPLPTPAPTGLTLQLTRGNAATVTIDLTAFQFGFHNPAAFPTGSIGATVGPVSFDALDVTAAYNANSPELFAQLTSGLPFDSAVLTQKDASGNPVAVWALSTVFVTEDALTGSGLPAETVRGAPTAPPTTEELRFAFEEITEGTSAGSRAWNQLTGRDSVPTLSAGLTLNPLPDPPTTGLTLQLAGTAVTLNLNTFRFGFHIPVSIGSVGGSPVGQVTFDTLDVTTGLSKGSPDLFHALASGDHYDTATLTETNSAGRPVAVWVLQTVFITDDTVTGNNGGLPAEELRFAFEDITEGTSAGAASWSLPTHSDTGNPGLPAGLNLSPLPTPPPTNLTLQLARANAATVTIDLTTFQFGFHNHVTIPTGGFGPTGGPVSFDALDVTAAYNANSPELFAQLTSGLPFDSAVLTQKDASGNTVAVWVLSTVFVTDDGLTGSGLPAETVRGAPTAPPTTEELRFAFEQITEETSASSASRNQRLDRNIGPAPPAGTPSPLPDPPATGLTLRLDGTPVTLNLNTFQFGFHSPVTIRSGHFATAGATSFDALEVTTAFNKTSPDLFRALASFDHYDTATLTETNAAGQPVAVWVLQTVFVADDVVTGNSGGLPAEGLRFVFGAITEVTNPNQASWDITRESAVGPGGPDPSTLAPLAPFAPTITVSAGPFTYDGNPHPATATATGVGGDPVNGSFTFTYYSGTSATGTGSPTAPSNAGTYTVVAHFSSADPNFQSIDSAAFIFHIAQAALTITANSTSKTYGQAVTFTGTEFTTSGLVNGDTVTGVTLTSAGAVAGALVAGSPYAIVPGNAVGTGLGNYTISYASGTLTVNPAPLTVTAINQSKIAGETNPTFTVTYSGFVLGQGPDALGGSLTLNTLATAGSAPGTYAITPGGLTSSNYAITFVSGTLTVISDAQATITLLAQVVPANQSHDIENSLISQLQAAIDSFNRGQTTASGNQLASFIHHVMAQRGKQIDGPQADSLIASAQRIINAAQGPSGKQTNGGGHEAQPG
jgi:type VI protein secretion system component Hcp